MIDAYQSKFESDMSGKVVSGSVLNFAKSSSGGYRCQATAHAFSIWMSGYAMAMDDSSRRIDATLFR